MRPKILLCLIAVLLTLSAQAAPRTVVLVGASVGEAWDFPQLASRQGKSGYALAYEGVYDFDKGAALEQVLSRRPHPDAVILKECAAYFPGDLPSYQKLVKRWVARCRQASVVPILATACPVTEAGEQLQGILAYNDWVRAYAAKEKLVVLDLEAAVRRSRTDRRLDPRCADEDGLHLVPAGYRRLDQIVFPALDRALAGKRPPGH
ncbi:MAG: SGNH/GDSL hydrolase family protein [Armatimonadetes bacterium]|nr:SGNH/GDSL hydrolase family protein [Armatimonadota bacterium]